MDCNRDEATRAKELAEKKVEEKNYAGAKRFALKAEKLYPGLEGLSQLHAVLNVFLASEKRIEGQINHYAILGVQPWDDESTIRKNFKKLALALHPDKNNAVGADRAFQLVNEAWSFVSVRMKQFPSYFPSAAAKSYSSSFTDNVMRFQRKPSPSQCHPHPHRPQARSKPRAQPQARSQPQPQPQPRPRPEPEPQHPSPQPGTFWSICNPCKMLFEFPKTYLNCNILCVQCRKPFLAIETPAPSVPSQTSGVSFSNAFSKPNNNVPAQASSVSQDTNVAQPEAEQSNRKYAKVPTNLKRKRCPSAERACSNQTTSSTANYQ